MKKVLQNQHVTASDIISLFRWILIPFLLWSFFVNGSICLILLVVSALLGGIAVWTESNRQSAPFFAVCFREGAEKLTLLACICCLAPTYHPVVALIGFFVIKEVLLFFMGYMAYDLFSVEYRFGWYHCIVPVFLYGTAAIFLLADFPDKIANILILCDCLAVIGSTFLHIRYYMVRFQKNILKITENKKWMITWKILIVLTWIGIGLICYFNKDIFTVDDIVSLTPKNTLLASVMILFLFAVKSLSIFLYSGVLYLVSGILLPLPLAILINFIGVTVMISIPYGIGKKGGAEIATAVTKNNKKAAVIKEFRSRDDFSFSCFLRMVGVFPSDILSLYMGAIGCKYWKYLLSCYIGALPSAILFPILGTNINTPKSPAFMISLIAELVIRISTILMAAISFKKAMKKMH